VSHELTPWVVGVVGNSERRVCWPPSRKHARRNPPEAPQFRLPGVALQRRADRTEDACPLVADGCPKP
jgi:hypothetical protein